MNPYRTNAPPSAIVTITREPRLPKLPMWGKPPLFSMVPIIVAAVAVACSTPKDTKTAADLTVKVADDVCKEIVDAGQGPDWMELACDTASGLVKVLLPRTEGRAILARKAGTVDAGPGK